jgi:hypothetical protein
MGKGRTLEQGTTFAGIVFRSNISALRTYKKEKRVYNAPPLPRLVVMGSILLIIVAIAALATGNHELGFSGSSSSGSTGSVVPTPQGVAKTCPRWNGPAGQPGETMSEGKRTLICRPHGVWEYLDPNPNY